MTTETKDQKQPKTKEVKDAGIKVVTFDKPTQTTPSSKPREVKTEGDFTVTSY